MKTGKRVLALNDDNHDTSFITEDGQYFSDYTGIIQFLATPHLEDYHVRYVYLLNIPEDNIEATEAFDILDIRGATSEKFNKSFNLLWALFGKENGFF